jgi:predicted ester cyclase
VGIDVLPVPGETDAARIYSAPVSLRRALSCLVVMTTTSSNKAAVERLNDATNSGDLDQIAEAIDELVEPDAVIHTPLPIEATGPELLKEVFARLLQAYPDLHITVEDLIEEGDRLVSRNTVTGTHRGEYMGISPTGRSVTYNEMFVVRFSARGRIAETWGIVDVLSQMRQLGAIAA